MAVIGLGSDSSDLQASIKHHVWTTLQFLNTSGHHSLRVSVVFVTMNTGTSVYFDSTYKNLLLSNQVIVVSANNMWNFIYDFKTGFDCVRLEIQL